MARRTRIVLSLFLFALLSTACGQTQSYRVAVLRLQHETCTFCPGGDVTVEDWTRMRPLLEGEEVLRGDSYIRGFARVASEYGDMEMVGITSPYGVFGGSSRSWSTTETYEYFWDLMEEDLRSLGPFDGVYLSLHGAMAVREIPRPEAETARRVREAVGAEVPIVATFDLHGNEDGEFLRWADGAFVTKRYPHYDADLQGERAARYLRNVMRGEYTPAKATSRPPIITATVLQWTGASPSMDIMERARRWEARVPGAYVSVFYGYPWSDVPDVGTTVHVMTDGDQQLADAIARDMAEFIWRVREPFAHGDFPMPAEAVDRARAAIRQERTPVVLADYSDRPGDATWILGELIQQGVDGVLYGCLRDERALERIREAGLSVGDDFDMEVGGFTGPQAGPPVRIRGTVAWRGERFGYEEVAVIRFGEESMLILTPAYEQVTTPGALRFGPIEPDDFDVFVLKSRVHFRRGFDETGYASTIIITDAPGPWVGTTRLDGLDYKHAPIDSLYPFGDSVVPPE
ncbi:MAG: M81 family metallopeptidase [bacterium]